MKSKELVMRSLEFDHPSRVPRQTWILPWAENNHPKRCAHIRENYGDDILVCPQFYTEPLQVKGDRYEPGAYQDEWGCVFKNIQKGVIGEVKDPILKDWADFDSIRIPEERLTVDKDEVNRFCRSTDRFVQSGSIPRPFERLQFIRGTVNAMMDLMDQPPELFALMDKIHNFYLKELEVWAKTEVDSLFIMDDWGSQNGMLVSPDLWRTLFKDYYRQYAEIAHSKGKALFMHSDGHILEIIPDLIEVGVDALNSQVSLMGEENLEPYKGKITFWGEPDRQDLLPNGDLKAMLQAVTKMKKHLYQDGGLIALCEFGLAANPDNICAFHEAWDLI